MLNTQENQESKENKDINNFVQNVLADNVPLLVKSFANAIKPIPNISILDWCEQNLYLPPEMSAQPGMYDGSITPYIREICDCLHPLSQYNEIVWVSPAQIAKTTVILNTMLYNIVNAPNNMIFGFPNEQQKNNFVSSRLNRFIDVNPIIKNKIFSKRARETGDTKSMKMFVGGTLFFASGESPSDWRSNPCRYTFIDEVDAMPLNVAGEGSPVDLARRRATTFHGRHKIFMASTPINGKSKILSEFSQTDQRHYFMPCPACGFMHEFEFKRLEWEAEGTRVKKTWYCCPKCQAMIFNEDKFDMMKEGVWLPTNENTTDPTKAGFWLNGMYSPWLTWNAIVTTYLEALAKNLESDLISFYNTILAEQYSGTNTTPEWQKLFNTAQASDWNMGEVPEDCLFLTSGSDVQIDRIETMVYGWGKYQRAKLIDHKIFSCAEGETTKDINAQCYKDWYAQIFQGTWTRKDGLKMSCIKNAMDRNYQTPTVNAFWEKVGDPKKFILVRGDDKMESPISSMKKDKPGFTKWQRERSQNKQRESGVYYYYLVGSSYLKRELYHALKTEDNPEHTINNVFMFPQDISEELCKQICSEVFIEPTEKHKYGYWKKLRDRNEGLDCTNYATACFYLLGAYKFSNDEWDSLALKLKKQEKPAHQEPAFQTQPKQPQIRILNKGIDI